MSDGISPLDYLRAMRDNRELSSHEKLVALVMLSHAGPSCNDAHPGERLLAAETGFTEKTVREHLRSLCDKGWMKQIFSGRGGSKKLSSAYNLRIPTGSGYRLREVQPVTDDRSTGNHRPVQSVTSDRSTSNGYRSNALGNALRNAPANAAPDSAVSGVVSVEPEGGEEGQGQASPADLFVFGYAYYFGGEPPEPGYRPDDEQLTHWVRTRAEVPAGVTASGMLTMNEAIKLGLEGAPSHGTNKRVDVRQHLQPARGRAPSRRR